jgi:outer membrane scaffolding protein for murein synthesis (MipA/OmpV family)
VKDKKGLVKVLIGILMLCLVVGMAAMVRAADYSIGGGVGIAPDYEGSDDYEVVPIPFGEIVFENGMYVRLEGLTLRANLIPSKIWRIGPMYNYRGSRSDVDNSAVDDMENVSDANELGAFAGFDYKNWFAYLEFLSDMGSAHNGELLTLKGGYNWRLSDTRAFSFGAHSTYASDDYMSTYFGVSGADSLRSGLATYDADSGIKDVGIDVGANWGITQSWHLRGIASYSLLVGDADDDSPVTDEGSEHQFFGGVLVVYSF